VSPTATQTDLEAITRDFFATWSTSFDGVIDGFSTYLAPDCDWDQKPMLRTRTRGGALKFLRVCHRAIGLETIDVELLSIAVRGNVVHTARIDHLYRKDGSLIGSPPVAGVLTFENLQIVHWKEYFDPAVFGVKAIGSVAGHAALIPVRALRRR
jgi:limonene-1,2-epoxide hydrolase